MSGYQYGDGRVLITGQPYVLRLTLGGLAELDARFQLSGSDGLSERLAKMTPGDARQLLEVLARQPLGDVTDAEIIAGLPEICRVIETAFGEINDA